MILQRLVVAVFGLASAFAEARDLSLAEAERLLAERGRELLAARRAQEVVETQRLVAAARPNPVLSINSVGVTTSADIAGPGPFRDQRFDTTLRIDQPFERGGKRELRMDTAELLGRAARADTFDTLRQQLALLRSAYYDLKQSEEKVAILQETAQLFLRTFAAAQARVKAGDLAAADAAKVQVDYERGQNDARTAQAELARAKIAFAYLIGEDRAAMELRAADAWPARTAPDPSDIEQRIELRPDVLAAKARVGATEKQRELARTLRTRDVTVGALLYRFPGSNVPGQNPDSSYTVGVGVAFPLFTGYDFSGEIGRAEVERQAALEALDKARALAANEIRRAASDLNAAAERLDRFDTSLLAAALRSAEAAEFAFQRGATSVLEVLDARRTLRAVRLEALAARTDHAKALVAWRASQTTVEMLGGK